MDNKCRSTITVVMAFEEIYFPNPGVQVFVLLKSIISILRLPPLFLGSTRMSFDII